MSDYKVIDKENWHRKDHFDFYNKFDNSCFNLCVPIKAQKLYEFAKDNNESFFQLTLFAILQAANSVPQMKQRLLGADIIEYSTINVMTPIMTTREAFRQVMCNFEPNFSIFSDQLSQKIIDVKDSKAGPMIVQGENFFCASCLPWLHFSSITHAEYHFSAAVPTLTWGKLEKGVIPISCKFNHSFVDGLHASRFFSQVEENLNSPDILYANEFQKDY
ncbi:CatA-like O-acetyltransferase, family 1 [Acinetobacter calcoaceticus]|uniref:CatA-like O-acetyltransferase, family 1 n=1 Tax=Acinetobacter calcoaceticus TaxID=471 RepID=UPI003F7BA4AE